jgi:O-antigen/teichoic acid export membrane protein
MGGWLPSVNLAIGLCASLLKWGPINWRDCRAHLRFGAVQFPGAVMWMLFLNIDIIALERVGDDPSAVGIYGFAAMLVRSLAFVFNAAGAAFFRDLANAWLNPPTMLLVHGRFLLAMTALGIAVSLVALITGQLLITHVYGGTFGKAGSVLSVLCLSIPLNALWIALSVINISGRKPQRSLAICAAGFVSSGAAIVPLIAVYGPIGAAWAVVFGNSIGVVVGALPIIPMVRKRRHPG